MANGRKYGSDRDDEAAYTSGMDDEMPMAFHERVDLLHGQSYCGFRVYSMEQDHEGVRIHTKNHAGHVLSAWGSDQVEAYKKVIDQIDAYHTRHPETPHR